MFYTVNGTVPLSSSAFPMFNAILIAGLLFLWRPSKLRIKRNRWVTPVPDYCVASGADFYTNLHSEAIAELPNGEGGKWVDVGCGRSTYSSRCGKGYNAVGIDVDSSMIREARKIARNENSSAVFEVGDVFKFQQRVQM